MLIVALRRFLNLQNESLSYTHVKAREPQKQPLFYAAFCLTGRAWNYAGHSTDCQNIKTTHFAKMRENSPLQKRTEQKQPRFGRHLMTGFCLPVDRTKHAKFGKEVTSVYDSKFPNVRLWVLYVQLSHYPDR